MAQYTQVCLEESRFEPCFGCRVGGGGIIFLVGGAVFGAGAHRRLGILDGNLGGI